MDDDPEHSSFFRIAKRIDKERKHGVLNPLRSEITIPNPAPYNQIIGNETKTKVLEVKLMDKGRSSVVVFSTPEAEAISGGGIFKFNTETKKIEFALPRFHLGTNAQLDLEIAMLQLAHTSLLKQIIGNSNPENSGIILFAREGPLSLWQRAVFNLSGKNLPTTIINVTHEKADNEFTRIARVSSKPNLEGFNSHKLDIIYLCDPIASGMQYVRVIEWLIKCNRKPKIIVAIAPMANCFGLNVIASFCNENKIEFKAGVCATLLDTVKPLMYYSPYPENINKIANIEVYNLISKIFGFKVHKFCIRGNWTATFFGGDKLPLIDSNKELKDLDMGLDNKALFEKCKKLTPEIAKNYNVLKSLIPYSTLLEIKESGLSINDFIS